MRRGLKARHKTLRPEASPLEERVLLSGVPTQWSSRGAGGGGALFSPAISPTNAGEIYIASDMGQLFHTTTAGKSWSELDFRRIQSSHETRVQFTEDPNILYSVDYTDPNGSGASQPIKSTDGGATWHSLVNDPTSAGAFRLFADPSNHNRLIVSDYTNLYFSGDGGSTWAAKYTNSNGGQGLQLAGAFFDGSNIYVGTNSGLLVSLDGGGTFALSSASGIPSGKVMMSFSGAKQGATTRFFAVTWDNADVYAGVQGYDYSGIATGSEGIYTLSVGQNSWTPAMTGIASSAAPIYVATALNDVNTAYVAGGSNPGGVPTVYQTTDAGAHWQSVFQTSNNQNIATGWQGANGDRGWTYGEVVLGLAVAPANAAQVVITDLGMAHETTNAGVSWSQLYVNPGDRNPAAASTPKGKAYHESGLDNTTAWGLNWVDASNILVSNSDIIGTHSIDGGNSFAFATSGNTYNSTYMTVTDPSTATVYAATSSIHDMYQSTHLTDASINSGSGAVLFSTTKGATWQTLHNFGKPVVGVAGDPTSAHRLYASVVNSTSGGIYVTNDLQDGATSVWTQLTNPPRTQGHPFDIRVLNDGTLVASFSGRRAGSPQNFTPSSGVFVSGDAGQTWSDRSDAHMLYWTTDVVVDPSDSAQNTWYAGVFSGWGGAANYLGGLYRTTDRGAHWSQISNLDRVSSVTVNPNNSTEAFLTTETQGLWYTADIHATVPSWTQVASYPFRQPERVFYNPYNPNEIWVTSFGSGLFVGTTSSAAAPSITWPNPADITYGTALGVSQLDAAANVPGVFTYSPVAGTVLNAGAGQTLSVLFAPADTVNYTAANATAAINVLKATPTVTWANPADITYGTPLGAAQLDATASVPGTFIYAPAAGTVLNAGNIPSLTATFLPADAQNVNIAIAHTAIHVLKAHLTVSAYNTAKLYGAVIPPLTYTLGGFVNGDTAGAANGAPGLSATATSSSIVGTYPITVSLGTLAANNYDFTFVAGTLTVSKAHLTVSADNKSRPLNQANPPLTSSLAGFVGGDTAAVVSGTALLSTTAVTSSLAGVYPISASLGTLASTNYDFPSFVSGTLTVNLPTPGDYNGDGKTDPAVFRRTGPFAMTWFVQGYPTLINRSFGAGSLDVPLSGDFDGDGKTDPALYRPSTAQWFVQKSSANYVGQLLTTFGWPGVDIPVPADYVGNGITVPAVYRPTTGEWFIMGQSTLTFTTVAAGDVPVPGNYDNTGKNEPAIYRPSTSQWIIDGPSGAHTILFGGPADVPVPGAYDATAANPSDEPAVFRPSTGQWFIHGPNGFRVIRFAPGDIPAQGDYEGVGKTEAVVYRPATLQWFVAGPADAVPRLLTTFGGPSDVPPDSPYVYRALKSGGHVALGVASSPPLDLGVSARVFNSVGTNSSAASPPARVHRRHPPQAAPTLRTRGQTLFKSHPSRAFQVS